MSAGWAVCVDFGTAFSKAAAAPLDAWSRFDPAQVRPLALLGPDHPGNPFVLDSAVFVDAKSLLFGARAAAFARELADSKRQALRSFKTILAASDLERALDTRAAGSIDPHRVFQLRDLVVLYLAYLARATDAAIAADPVLSNTTLRWRYASPAWQEDRDGAHRVIERLFGEARVVRAALGEQLASGEVSIDAARAAVEAARTDAGAAEWRMDMVYEATAAAAASAIADADRDPNVIVIDVGAGTSDIGGLVGLRDLPEARVTLGKAGDYIDRVLLNLAVAASPWLKTPTQQGQLWTAMAHGVRETKEGLFADARASFRFEDRVIKLNLKDFERDKDFKRFEADLTRAYARSLKALREAVRRERGKRIIAVAVGGGAAAPFVQRLIATNPGGGVKAVPRPATPQWAHAPNFAGNLGPVFPQLAVAIGGALAPDVMLAARRR